MARKMYEIAFELAGKVNSSFNSTFGSARSKLVLMNQKIVDLRRQVKSLEKIQKKNASFTKEQAESYQMLTRQLEKAERAQRKLANATNLQNKVNNFRSRSRVAMIGAAETAFTIGAPVNVAMKFESSMADVKKVIDFETPDQFKAMGKDIVNLSKRIPMASDQLANIVAAGGQAGIARKDLIGFAESAAKMGVAFDISAEEAGETMAQWRSAFKINQKQVNILADQINYLGNTTAASAPKISEVVKRIGPLGDVGGTAASEIAALGATMVSSGITEEVAATGIKNLVLTLTAGEAATKSQREAFAALGMDAEKMSKMMQEDAQGAIMQVMHALQQLPEHDQASVMSKLFGKESIGAIAPLLTNLNALKNNFNKVADANKYAGSMQKEFESRAATTENNLILLKNHVSVLGITLGSILLPHITQLAEKLSKGADKVQDFAEKHPTLTRVLITGTTAVLGFSVALAGLGYIGSIIISPFISMYTWSRKIELAQKLAASSTKAWTFAQKAWNFTMLAGNKLLSISRLVVYRAKTIAIATATKAWTAAQWLWNVAMSANPIGLIILGIGALIGAGYLLIKNWDKVKAWFVLLWNNPKEALGQFVDYIKEKFSGIFNWIGEKWDKVKSWFGFGKRKSGDSFENLTERDIPGHAAGGIFNRPHLAWFAENGPEAAIPLDGSKRSLSLFEQTGLKLGVFGKRRNTVRQSPMFVYSPTIYGGDSAEIKQTLDQDYLDFQKKMEEFLNRGERLSFA